MTKRDYEAIANAVHTVDSWEGQQGDYSVGWHECITSVENILAGIFVVDNPRFDAAKFLDACRNGVK